MIVIELFICKLIGSILRLFKRGSNLPGELAFKMNKRFLKYFKMPNLVIAVTGSAGKGSTCSIIENNFKLDGKKVIYNKSGSNMLPGILSLFIMNSKLNGTIDCDVLVAEVDERYTKIVFDMIKPKYVVITNICRDQPPRHGNYDLVFNKIKEALTCDMHLILNGDDPYLMKFNLENEYKVSYYGMERNKFSYKNNKFENINIKYCPVCNNKLDYDYYHFESIGSYKCSNCDFKRPKIDVLAKVYLDKKYMVVNGNKVNISFDMLYYAYNILASYTVCKLCGMDEISISKYISSMENNRKLNDVYKFRNRNVYILNNKNENSTTFNQSILFTMNKKVKKTIVIGWKEISRRYEFNDMSWLYDIEFELLNDKNTDKVICVGRDAYDIATRMKYAGFSNKQIRVYDDLDSSSKDIKFKSKGDIFAIVNFDYVIPFKEMIEED